jgi:NTP pyrophosphatase (non-canonical NTP hydrolase)
MTFNDYQKKAFAFASVQGKEDPILNSALGLAGESGECADLVKKNRFQGHELDKEKLEKELGDVLWYIAEAASGLGINLENIAVTNIDKLSKRYPEGHFNVLESINRKDKDQ